MTMWRSMAVGVAAVYCVVAAERCGPLSPSTCAERVEECGAMGQIELGMVKPKIASCQDTSPFTATEGASTKSDLDSVCGEETTCGELLPYLAYMKKNPCKERMAFNEFADSLLTLCANFSYKSIDPKSILVGKPPPPAHVSHPKSSERLESQRHRRPEPQASS